MAIPILMPALSPTMTEGKLSAWLIKEGDTVSAGDVMAEIETDKATMEFEAVDEGVLGKILVAEGTEGVAVNTPIAVLLEEGEKIEDVDLDAMKAGEGAPVGPPPAEEGDSGAQAEKAPEPAKAAAATPAAAPSGGDGKAPAAPKGDGRIFASPLARRLAKQAGLDLSGIKGSGPHGRIVKRDVEGAEAQPAAKQAAAAKPAAAAPAAAAPAEIVIPEGVGYDEVPLSSMRKTIARRLTEAKQTIPHIYLTVDVELDALLALRKELNAKAPEGVKLSVNDFVIRAMALALKRVPDANASFAGDRIIRYHNADIGVAVALPDNGLITPIVFKADTKGLAAISEEVKEKAGRARERKLKPEEYQGGGFAISNLGMYGIKDFAAVVNPPHGGILAVGMGEQRPVVKDGALAVATVMTCTLSTDHRVVDGALGAQLLAAFKGFVEDPMTMML
ncbi:pyruvate dehydrogenase complex dihydrolipoamide acetyltransferase [Marinibaculum pumilum]|uniref:Acetyltransferase component of pyruvate dehydrogenase complex n=1 Tax=Marinibaculum pumilum TaxID=1766165 RepID=A0ABV7KV08_9PROT